MATKAEKRARMQAKRAEREEALRQEGLAALQADREEREKARRDAKIKASKDLLEQHEREKASKKAIADARREEPTPGQILATYSLLGSLLEEPLHQGNDEPIDLTRYGDDTPIDPRYTACSFALGRGEYCKGDVRFPATHSTKCPGYNATDIAFSNQKKI